MPKLPVVRIFFLFAAVLACMPKSLPAQGDTATDVLLLNSYHQGMEWTEDVTRAVMDTFADYPTGIDLHVENMDTKRILNDQSLDALYNLLSIKYSAITPELILSSDNNAFEFLRRNHARLFPKVPVVFCGVNFFNDDSIRDLPLFTGVAEMFDVVGTLDIALKLHPETTNIYVIHDHTPTGLAWAATIKEDTKGKYPNLTFTYSKNLSIRETAATLKTLEPGTLALLTVFFRDAEGTFITTEERDAAFSQALSVPMYGLLDFDLDHGIVGGKLISGYYQGKSAAQLGLRILKGERPQDIQVVKFGANRVMFDFNQLKEFNIALDQLPSKAEVINKPTSFYDSHREIIWAAALFISLESLIIIILLINISRRKQAERELKQSEEQYRSIFENAMEGIFQSTIYGRFINANTAMARILGYDSPKELMDTVVDIGLQIYSSQEARKHILSLLEKEIDSSSFETQIKRKDDSLIWVEVHVRVAHDHEGMPFFEGVMQDVTHRVEAAQAMLEAQRELEHADNMKTALISSISHELKTPLTSLVGYVQLIDSKLNKHILPHLAANSKALKSAEQIITNLNVMAKEAHALHRLIQNVLDLMELSSQTVEIQFDPLAPKDFILPAVEATRPAAEAKGLNIQVDVPGDCPEIKGDQGKLSLLMHHILTNAVTYTDAGKIHVSARKEDESLIVDIHDTGCGIAKEDQERIFDAFYQVGDALTGKNPGPGIGLTIARTIARLHHGDIDVHSRPGKSSTFTLRLPVVD